MSYCRCNATKVCLSCPKGNFAKKPNLLLCKELQATPFSGTAVAIAYIAAESKKAY